VKNILRKLILTVSFILLLAARPEAAEMTDDAGQRHNFAAPPAKVVSLIPSVTEIICEIGASGSLAGVTYHDAGLEGTAGRTVVGGADSPLFEVIRDVGPDLLIISPRDFERAKAERGGSDYPILVMGDAASLAEAEKRALMIGELFGRRSEAERIVSGNRAFMETIRMKTERIPPERRKKAVMLSMGPGGPVSPGDASCQAEMLRAAGGVTGWFPGGEPTPVTPELLREISPDFVITASSEYGAVRALLGGDDWRDAPARVAAFPDALVNRAAAHTGYFVAWLSSEMYSDEFADEANLVHPTEITGERAISLDIPYVERARIVESRIMDFTHRTLVVDFKRPQRVISTNGGERDGVMTVGNSYSPTPTWSVYHKLGFERSQKDMFDALGINPASADIMLTGADMNNAVVKTASHRDMTVTAIVTAGAESNAIRTSRDTGAFYEPGTINILVMTNHALSERALSRAIVTITEAKTAALWDMDIRSSQSRATYPATGTGTDTVLVVAGEGATLHGSGGHTKMGELIADAVHRGVRDALLKQNGKAPARGVIERLEERGVRLREISPDGWRELEGLLLSPSSKNVRGFMEAAFSLSDARVMGQISDLGAFDAWALSVAGEIAGKPVERLDDAISADGLPVVLKTALDALITGISRRAGP
jgi:adenosylcobinamide amidohydrolase/ABC-type Fe3+-hydroxamate transport system substrate-binding protein